MASESVNFEVLLVFMIGEFLLRVSLLNEERIMYEESSNECQHGDKDWKKVYPPK